MAGVLGMVNRAMPGKLLNVFAYSAGGGKLLAVMPFRKAAPVDEGRPAGVLGIPRAKTCDFGGRKRGYF